MSTHQFPLHSISSEAVSHNSATKRNNIINLKRTTTVGNSVVVFLRLFFVLGVFCLPIVVHAESQLIVDVHREAPRQLKQYKQHLQNQQWNSALEIIVELQNHHGSQFLKTKPSRFISLTDYCQRLIADGPRELLQLYRQQIDSLSESEWQYAFKQKNERALLRLVRTNFCSQHTDNALKLLAELGWERKGLLPPLPFSLAEKHELTLQWKRSLPFSTLLNAPPVVDGDHLYLSHRGKVYGYHLDSGQPPFEGMEELNPVIYETHTTAGSTSLPAANFASVDDGRLYALLKPDELSGSLVCLDMQRAEGKLHWKVPASLAKEALQFQGSPLVLRGKVYWIAVGTGSANRITICCLNANDGSLIWTSNICSSIQAWISPEVVPVLSKSGSSILISVPGKMTVEVASVGGHVRWIREEKLMPAQASPMIIQNETAFLATETQISAIDLTTGKSRWNIERPNQGQLIPHIGMSNFRELLFLTIGQIEHLNLQSGQIEHTSLLPEGLKSSFANLRRNSLFVSGENLILINNQEISLYRWESSN